jgi:hypothetical protein
VDKLQNDLDIIKILKKQGQHQTAAKALLSPIQFTLAKLQLSNLSIISDCDRSKQLTAKVSATEQANESEESVDDE